MTSAVAAPAYAGIPLTHRDLTSTVAFVTGHEDPTKADTSIAWDKIATGVGTLVFFMGVGQAARDRGAVRWTTGARRKPPPRSSAGEPGRSRWW